MVGDQGVAHGLSGHDSAKSGRVNSANVKAISQRNYLPLFRRPVVPATSPGL
jgi:hypothetical protein